MPCCSWARGPDRLASALRLQVGQQSYQRKIMEQQAKGQISPEVMEKLLTPQMLQNYIKANKEEVEDTVKVPPLAGLSSILRTSFSGAARPAWAVPNPVEVGEVTCALPAPRQ